METGPNYELLKDAYAIIDGIPEAAIAFGAPRSQEGPSLADGTICSPEGWLAQHPRFMQLGLSMSRDGSKLYFLGEPDFDSPPALIMAKVFDMAPEDARQLFGERSLFTTGDDSGLSDKRLWLQRMRDYLRQQGQLEQEQAEQAPEAGMLAGQMQQQGAATGAFSPP